MKKKYPHKPLDITTEINKIMIEANCTDREAVYIWANKNNIIPHFALVEKEKEPSS